MIASITSLSISALGVCGSEKVVLYLFVLFVDNENRVTFGGKGEGVWIPGFRDFILKYVKLMLTSSKERKNLKMMKFSEGRGLSKVVEGSEPVQAPLTPSWITCAIQDRAASLLPSRARKLYSSLEIHDGNAMKCTQVSLWRTERRWVQSRARGASLNLL